MANRLITKHGCGRCGADLRSGEGTRRIAVVDRDLDCVVAHKCPDCGTQENESAETIARFADPAALKNREG